MKRLLGLRVVAGALFICGLGAASCTAMTSDDAMEGVTATVEQATVANPNLKYYGTTLIGVTNNAGIVTDDRLDEVRTFSNVAHVPVLSLTDSIGPRLRQLRAENIKAIVDVSQIFFQNTQATWHHCAYGDFPIAAAVSRNVGGTLDLAWNAFVANNNLTDADVKAGIVAFMFSDEPGLHSVSMNDLNGVSQYIKSTLAHQAAAPVRTMYVESSVVLNHPAEGNPAVTVFGNSAWSAGACDAAYDNYLTAASTPANVDFPSVDIYYLNGLDANGGTQTGDPYRAQLTLARFNNALRAGQKMFVFGQADHDESFGTDLGQADEKLRDSGAFLFAMASASNATNVAGYMTYHWGADGLDPTLSGGVCRGAGSKLADGNDALPLTREQHFTQGAQVLPGGLKTIFDFSTSMPAGVAFNRGSTGTYYNANGIMQTAAANTPRFEYYNGQSMGLLLEPAATNLLCKSEAFGATGTNPTCNWKWDNVNIENVAPLLYDPTNTPSVRPIQDTSTNSVHGVYQNVAMTASRKYVFSVFVRPESLSQVALVAVNKAGTKQTAMFQLAGNGSILAGSIPSSGIVKYGSWYRVMMAFDSATGAAQPSVGVYLMKDSMTQYVGNPSRSLSAWGAQLELGAGTNIHPNPTSYIKTDIAPAARNADNLNLAVTPLAISQGTFSVEIADVLKPAVDDTIGSTLLHFDDLNTSTGVTTHAWDVKVDQASKMNLSVVKLVNGVPTVLANQTSANSLGAGYQAKFAFGYAEPGLREIVSGLGTYLTPNFTPAVANPTTPINGTWTRMFVGRDGSGAARFTGHVRTIRFFPYDVYGGGAGGKTLEFKDLTLIVAD